ncbi:MAG TPA: uridine kinase [Terriglobales bacterium]|nr:uridine kinase [Terriglobales bacterium]
MTKTHIIAIAGPSCAGKTETSKVVARKLNAPILSLDSYYRPLDHLSFEERTKFNFDEPAALDHELLIQQLAEAAGGKTVHAPVYDFVAHSRSPQIETIEPGAFLILEGLFVLWWDDVRNLCDTTVYVDAPDELCLERRKYRDVRERGRSVESVVRQYEQTVRPMAAKYVWPTRKLAQLVVSGTDSLEHCAAQVLQTAKVSKSEFATAD